MDKPTTFEEAKKLLGHSELPNMLDQMLIHLAFGDNATVAFRAIELLLLRPRDEPKSDLDDLTDDQLEALKKDLEIVYKRYHVETE